MSPLTTRLRGVAATFALIAIVAGIPALLLAINALPRAATFSWSRLTERDDGTLAIQVITAVCWIAWAVFTCQLINSIVCRLRGLRAPRWRGLVVPQLAADRLVAAAALLFVAVPAASAVLPQPRAHAALAPQLPQTPAPPATAPKTPPPARSDKPQAPATERYIVKRGDSLWKIAEQHLGDGTRYVELVDLNKAVLHGRPDFLQPGTVLRVPIMTPTHEEDEEEYVVQPGDTLSEIAEHELGDADAYPSIYDASRATAQPHKTHLTDPDLIVPGWRLTIPQHSSDRSSDQSSDQSSGQPSGTSADEAPHPARDQGPTIHRPSVGATDAPTGPSTSPEDSTVAPAAPAASSDTDRLEPPTAQSLKGDESVTPSWLQPGLAGASAVLGASLWIALRAKRRTQLRHRRPGTIIAPPPPELLPIEKTTHASASLLAPDVAALDATLRRLDPRAQILTATLSDTTITLDLVSPTHLEAPWYEIGSGPGTSTGVGTSWQIALADAPPRPEDSFPPYPLLVSIGHHHPHATVSPTPPQPPPAGQGFVFLNLEQLRTIHVTGDTERKAGFARHLAAELAINPWSDVTRVDVVGLGSDLASFNLGRIQTHPVGDTDFLVDLTRDLTSTLGEIDPDDFQAAIIATPISDEISLAQVATVLASAPGRAATALINLTEPPLPEATVIEIDTDGHLRVASLGLDIQAATLSAEEARACALLLDLTLEQRVVPVPRRHYTGSTSGSADPEADRTDDRAVDGELVTDVGGALVPELTVPRGNGSAGDASLLPLSTDTYAARAATLDKDIQLLAPLAAPAAARTLAEADPSLDEDLARWESPILLAPKLTLLGPVAVRTMGDPQATAHRRAFYLELLAYLALRPSGATAEQIADAFNIRVPKARSELSVLRRWLGQNKAGQPYLPRAQQSHHDGEPARYALDGVLCDLDLFRRLRGRGQSRGADGLRDLVAALHLVSGEPFTALRKDGWTWLLDGDRLDHIMTAAIVDVGHIVTTHALTTGDLHLADVSSQIAHAASPYDDIATLDRAAVERATGDTTAAQTRLRYDIHNRSDDALGPIELPQRTERLTRHDLTPGERRRA